MILQSNLYLYWTNSSVTSVGTSFMFHFWLSSISICSSDFSSSEISGSFISSTYAIWILQGFTLSGLCMIGASSSCCLCSVKVFARSRYGLSLLSKNSSTSLTDSISFFSHAAISLLDLVRSASVSNSWGMIRNKFWIFFVNCSSSLNLYVRFSIYFSFRFS